jgi:hypothetical protein
MQVLGNAELRTRYDAHGSEALDVNFMDSAEFFAALFGSDRFEHLVGELMLAAAARHGGDFNANQLRKLQVGHSLFCRSLHSLRLCAEVHSQALASEFELLLCILYCWCAGG